jgi:hypothetical protein
MRTTEKYDNTIIIIIIIVIANTFSEREANTSKDTCVSSYSHTNYHSLTVWARKKTISIQLVIRNLSELNKSERIDKYHK